MNMLHRQGIKLFIRKLFEGDTLKASDIAVTMAVINKETAAFAVRTHWLFHKVSSINSLHATNAPEWLNVK